MKISWIDICAIQINKYYYYSINIITAAGNRPESVHAKPTKPLAVTKHSSYGENNILALMTLQKAVVLKCQLSPTPNLFFDAATEKTYRL